MKKSPWSDVGGSKGRPRSAASDELEDPLNPAIPKAPLVPHDIGRMPNAALPIWSNPPDHDGAPERPTLSAIEREHVDARPPPGVTPSTYQSAAMPLHSASLPRIPGPSPAALSQQSLEPDPTGTPASPRPTPIERATQSDARRGRWIALAIALGLAALAAWIHFARSSS